MFNTWFISYDFLLLVTLKRGKLLQTISEQNKCWYLSFQVKLYGVVTDFGNIVRLTLGHDMTYYGDRNPSITTAPGSTLLYVASSVSGNLNYVTNTGFYLPLNTWVSVVAKQLKNAEDKYYYTIMVNGKAVLNVENTQAEVFKNVQLFAGDPWHSAANGAIKNLVYKNIYEGC